MKRSGPLRRRKPLKRGKPLRAKSPLRDRKPLRPVNPERIARLREQQFGGRHRDRIVSLPCCACGRLGPSDPAHVRPRGMGGVKGKWWEIVPLCRRDHRAFDEYRGRFADPEVRRELELRAWREAWVSWEYGYAPGEPPVPRPERL